jgi:hypothetical protein
VDFVSFLRDHPAGKHYLVAAFLDCEDSINNTVASPLQEVLNGRLLALVDEIALTDIPIKKKHTRIVSLSCEVQPLIDALKSRSEPVWVMGNVDYVTKELTTDTAQLVRVSDWVASVLRCCDGTLNIAEVIAYLKMTFTEIGCGSGDYLWPKLIDGIRQQGFIDIYRLACEGTDSQLKDGQMLAQTAEPCC